MVSRVVGIKYAACGGYGQNQMSRVELGKRHCTGVQKVVHRLLGCNLVGSEVAVAVGVGHGQHRLGSYD